MANTRTYSQGRFALDINGANAGYLQDFEGFNHMADVVKHGLGPDNFEVKHIGNIDYSPAKFSIGMGMGNEMYQWIRSAFEKDFVTKSGTFTAADFNYKAQHAIDFQDALISSVTIPPCDARAKDPKSYFKVECKAERVRHLKGNGADIRGKLGPKQKAWSSSNFEFTMGDLPLTRCSKIDAIELKCTLARDQVGLMREPTLHPTSVTVPNITFEISAADADAFYPYVKSWFEDGKCEATDEMQGQIRWLDNTMQKTLGTLQLQNCGFVKYEMPQSKANGEAIKSIKVEMYVEVMKLKLDYVDSST